MGVTLTHTAQCGPSALQSSHTARPMVFNFKKDHIFLLNFYPGLFNDSPASSLLACLQVCRCTSQVSFSNKGKLRVFPSENRFVMCILTMPKGVLILAGNVCMEITLPGIL